MNKYKVSVNDVLEALAIRINDVLRPDKKSKNKKNNAYFWIFKFLLLCVLLWIVHIVFNNFIEIGVSLIYAISKSLRSVLSFIWVISLSYIKGILVLYLLYDNYKSFVTSEYYDNLYLKNRKLRNKKEVLFKTIEIVLKVFAVFNMIAIAGVAAVSVYALITVILMLFDNIYIISPIIIFMSLFLISFFTFMHIKNKFFAKEQTIAKNHFIFSFVLLVIGVGCFWYETSSYEYYNGLPDDMNLVYKEQTFKINEEQRIKIKNNSKLNNLKVIYDDTLDDELVIQLEYFETADVRYYYRFNSYDDLDITFTSSLDFHPENVEDVSKLIFNTFNRKTIYNYNLFKYPNIYVFINPKYKSLLTVK